MTTQSNEPDTEMTKPGRKGVQRVIWAAYYSYRGIRSALQNEAAFRQELVLMLILIPLAFWMGETVEQQLLLIGPCVLVVVVELLNSAIEAVVDRIGSERHILSGQAKDMGSAAVFFCLFLVVLSWGLIGWNRLMG
jgi:diacylglycerol kinase (ATP)